MKKFSFIIYSLLLILCINACSNDNEVNNPDPLDNEPTEEPIVEVNIANVKNYVPETENVTATVHGFIQNQTKLGLKNVSVTIGNSLSTQTDDLGHFVFKDVTLNAKGTYLKAELDGYFLGSRRFYPKSGDNSFIKIQLIEKVFDQNFSAASGGEIECEDKAKVFFKANSIQDEAGNLYTGNVQVASTYLNPTEYQTSAEMPGDLAGFSAEDEVGILNTFGMINVELQDDNGNPLNIAEDNSATIQMDIPESMLQNSPEKIALWTFNEDRGIWLEEGFANLENGKYKGEVSHFSWWNCDVWNTVVELDFNLKNHEGNYLSNVLIQLVASSQNSLTATAYTNLSGGISGLVPINETMTLNVFDICGNIVNSQVIGPFSANTSMGDIYVNLYGVMPTVTLTGELVDCSGNYVQNGVVKIDFNGNAFISYLNSNPFVINVPTCLNTGNLEIKAIDADNFLESNTVTFAANSTVNIGQFQICNNALNNYIVYKIGTLDSITVYEGEATVANNQIEIFSSPASYNVFNYVYISIDEDAPGTYTNAMKFEFLNSAIGSNNQNTLINNIDAVTLTQVPSVGGQITGSFIGSNFSYSDNSGAIGPVSIEGYFSIERTQ